MGAQDLGIMPEVNLTTSISERLKWRTSLESRFQVFEQGDDFIAWGFEAQLADFTNLILWQSGANTSIGGGYLVRIRDEFTQHRTIQQFRLTIPLSGSRLGHRLVTDQTYSKNDPTRWRVRYRITWEKPLNGQRVDEGEWYLKLANEYLYLTQDGSSDWEIRISPVMGYEIGRGKGFEAGIDARLKRLATNSETEAWLTLTYFAPLRFSKSGHK